MVQNLEVICDKYNTVICTGGNYAKKRHGHGLLQSIILALLLNVVQQFTLFAGTK
jgi:hypothetical protein